jgi:rhodanese-related sulfurtransferase
VLTAAELVSAAEREITTITVEEARAAMNDPNSVLIDIRDVRELWREGKIPGALHSPRGMNEFWIDPTCEYHKPIYASGKRFVIYCAAASQMSPMLPAGLGPGKRLGFPLNPLKGNSAS